MKRFLFSIIFISVLFACNNDLSLDNVKEDKNENRFVIKANIDTEYEYADDEANNETRNIGITGEDAPRVVLQQSDFQGGTTNINYAYFRTYFAAFKYSTTTNNNAHVGGIYDALNVINPNIKLVGQRGSYTLIIDARPTTDYGAFYPVSDAVWSMDAIIGGWPYQHQSKTDPNDGRLQQWFGTKAYSHGSVRNGVIETAPNHKIVHLVGDNSTRRHFPLVSTYYPAGIDVKSGVIGVWSEGGKNNLYIGRDEAVKLEPRGSVFSFKLKNETGKNIKVTHIESPYRNGFAFEGYFAGLKPNPIKAPFGTKDQFRVEQHWDWDKARLPFIENPDPPHGSNNRDYGSFPVYTNETTQGYLMDPDQTSEGRFLVWAYPLNGGTTKFRVRVKYEIVGESGSHESKAMEVRLPSSGSYQEGKSYRALLTIKP